MILYRGLDPGYLAGYSGCKKAEGGGWHRLQYVDDFLHCPSDCVRSSKHSLDFTLRRGSKSLTVPVVPVLFN
jgi:hypothetical protein